MLHEIGERYGPSPAAQMGIDDPLAAIVVNNACLWAGLNRPPPPKTQNLDRHGKKRGS